MLLVWIDAMLEWGKFIGFHWYIRIRSLVVKLVTIISVSLLLLWVAVFLYGCFYYAYMPSVSHVRDVNLQFSADCDAAIGTLCSFPTANLSLLADNQREIFMKGQPYVVLIELQMPESPVNQQVGMFMVMMKVHSYNGHLVQTGWRAGLMEYKSTLYRLAETIIYLPSYLMGSSSQQQIITLQLFDSFVDDPYHPAQWAIVEVQSKVVQIYTVTLKVHARFTGLRYVIFHWPIVSAIAGVASNMFFLILLATMSWFRFIWSKQNAQHVPAIEPGAMEQRRRIAQALLQRERAQSVEVTSSSMYSVPGSPVDTGPAYYVQNIADPNQSFQEDRFSEGSEEEIETLTLSRASLEEVEDRMEGESLEAQLRQRHPPQP